MSATNQAPPQQRSLQRQLVMLLVGVVTTSVVICAGWFIDGEQRLLRHAMEQRSESVRAELASRGMTLARGIALSSERAVVVMDFLFLTEVIASTVEHDPDILYGVIMDENRRALVHSNLAKAGRVDDSAEALHAMKMAQVGTQLMPRNNVVEAVAPILVNETRWGTIRLGLSLHRVSTAVAESEALAKEARRNALISATIGVLILILICSVMARAMASRIVAPLNRLMAVVHRVQGGDLSEPAFNGRTLEFTLFAQALGEMTAAMRERDEKIQEHHRTLEDQVTARTAGMRAAMENLRLEKQNSDQLFHELQASQSMLVQNEKMSSLGVLIAGVAHEFNNPVNYLSLSLPQLFERVAHIHEVLVKVRPKGEQGELFMSLFQEDMDDIGDRRARIRDACDRLKRIVLSLNNFAHQDRDMSENVSIHDGIDSTLLILGPRLRGINVCKEYGKLPPITCKPGDINQVVMNICNNAADAMEEANTAHPKLTVRSIFSEEKDKVIIEFEDNGPGIPAAVQARIFDPFFSTKDVGKGTGLGLSISYKIVQGHAGALQIETGDWGTKFKLELPRTQNFTSLLRDVSVPEERG